MEQRLRWQLAKELRKSDSGPTTLSPYFSLLSSFTPIEMFEIARRSSLLIAKQMKYLQLQLPPGWIGHIDTDLRSRHMRIGYISADYRNHVTMHLLRGIFDRHRPNIDVFCYVLNRDDGSEFRRVIRERVGDERWYLFCSTC